MSSDASTLNPYESPRATDTEFSEVSIPAETNLNEFESVEFLLKMESLPDGLLEGLNKKIKQPWKATLGKALGWMVVVGFWVGMFAVMVTKSSWGLLPMLVLLFTSIPRKIIGELLPQREDPMQEEWIAPLTKITHEGLFFQLDDGVRENIYWPHWRHCFVVDQFIILQWDQGALPLPRSNFANEQQWWWAAKVCKHFVKESQAAERLPRLEEVQAWIETVRSPDNQAQLKISEITPGRVFWNLGRLPHVPPVSYCCMVFSIGWFAMFSEVWYVSLALWIAAGLSFLVAAWNTIQQLGQPAWYQVNGREGEKFLHGTTTRCYAYQLNVGHLKQLFSLSKYQEYYFGTSMPIAYFRDDFESESAWQREAQTINEIVVEHLKALIQREENSLEAITLAGEVSAQQRLRDWRQTTKPLKKLGKQFGVNGVFLAVLILPWVYWVEDVLPVIAVALAIALIWLPVEWQRLRWVCGYWQAVRSSEQGVSFVRSYNKRVYSYKWNEVACEPFPDGLQVNAHDGKTFSILRAWTAHEVEWQNYLAFVNHQRSVLARE